MQDINGSIICDVVNKKKPGFISFVCVVGLKCMPCFSFRRISICSLRARVASIVLTSYPFTLYSMSRLSPAIRASTRAILSMSSVYYRSLKFNVLSTRSEAVYE